MITKEIIENNLRKEIKLLKEENGYLRLENKLQMGEIEFLKKRLSIAQNESFIKDCTIEFKKIIKLLEAKIETCVACGEIIPEGRQICPKCEAAAYGEKEVINGIKKIINYLEIRKNSIYNRYSTHDLEYCINGLRELLK